MLLSSVLCLRQFYFFFRYASNLFYLLRGHAAVQQVSDDKKFPLLFFLPPRLPHGQRHRDAGEGKQNLDHHSLDQLTLQRICQRAVEA